MLQWGSSRKITLFGVLLLWWLTNLHKVTQYLRSSHEFWWTIMEASWPGPLKSCFLDSRSASTLLEGTSVQDLVTQCSKMQCSMKCEVWSAYSGVQRAVCSQLSRARGHLENPLSCHLIRGKGGCSAHTITTLTIQIIVFANKDFCVRGYAPTRAESKQSDLDE